MHEVALDIMLEAILFSASEPLSISAMSRITIRPSDDVKSALALVQARLTGGIRLAHMGETYRLVTAPEATVAVREFLQDTNRQDLSRPALETLAIIAYKGPLTKSRIDEIRGVSSEAMLRNLMARALITEAGHSKEPGKPQLYGVSHTFLQHFGLTSTSELPPLPKAEK